LDGNTPDANEARINQAVEADSNRQAEERGGQKRTVGAQPQQCQRKAGEPQQASRPEKVVEKTQPDGGHPVKHRDRPVCVMEAQQRGGDEAEGQDDENSPQRQRGRRAERRPEVDPGAIDKPMGRKQKGLHQRDAHNWPCLQKRISLHQFLHERGIPG
jgi:hypothetical protein